jgi:transcriptional regulator with GAF, ATPase, and Fis domain
MPGIIPDTTAVRRRLWLLGAVLIAALAVAVVILSEGQGGRMLGPWHVGQDAKRLGLLGLVGLFIVYVLSEERRLASKEAELQKVLVREVALRARLTEFSELLEATTEMACAFDFSAVLALAARRVLPCLEAQQAAILLLNRRTGLLEGAAVAGTEAEGVRAARLIAGEGVVGYVHSTGEPLVVESEEMRQRLARELGLEAAPGSAVCVPLRFQKAGLGVFCVCRGRESEPLTPAHARMLQPLAEHCAAAIVKSVRARGTPRDASIAA